MSDIKQDKQKIAELYTIDLVGERYQWAYIYTEKGFSSKEECLEYWANVPDRLKYAAVWRKNPLHTIRTSAVGISKGFWYWALNTSKGFSTKEDLYEYWNRAKK